MNLQILRMLAIKAIEKKRWQMSDVIRRLYKYEQLDEVLKMFPADTGLCTCLEQVNLRRSFSMAVRRISNYDELANTVTDSDFAVLAEHYESVEKWMAEQEH